MKRLYSFIALSLLLSAPLFSTVITSSLMGGLSSLEASGGDSFTSLWKAEQKLEADGKPQSAYAATMKILQKAEKKGRRGQALSARLRAASLHQEWAPDSFFTDIQELEDLRRAETAPEARAVYASILAEIYENNKGRSQAYDLELTSHNMKEWTQEQYDSAASTNWNLSLADIPALGKAKSRDWLPFVQQNASSDYFRHDLLHILWQRVRDQRRSIWGPQQFAIEAQQESVEAYYRQQGNREAALLIALDGDPDLQQLKDEFADLPLCTEVYLKLLDTYATDSQKVVWAEEAIRRYPRYQRIGEVRNTLNELRQPNITWNGADLYYPGYTYKWRLSTKNTASVQLEVFRLKKELEISVIKQSQLSVADYLRRHATLVQTLTPDIRHGDPTKTQKDTIDWTAPGVGLYAILYTATTNESEATLRELNTQYHTFRVTALRTMERTLPDSTLEVIVVDAESGQPVSDAVVTLYQNEYRTHKRIDIGQMKSNAEGRAHFKGIKRNAMQFYVEAKKGDDVWLPASFIYRDAPTLPYDQGSEVIRLYTDRAIYRPGQSVHLGGIVYREKHWDATPVENRELELILRDANSKEVTRQTAKTDEWGVFAADFTLPEGRLPGRYTIQTNHVHTSFRVEEYKRPTFDVTMDEAPALQWPQDSIVLTGKAMGFNGVPVRDGRITGTYQFTYPYWWYRHDDSPRQQIDTLFTDDTGTLRVAVPLKEIPKEALRYGLFLALDVEVLSPAGETREGSIRVPLCTEPLRLFITMNEQQERSRITPPTFSLLSSTGQPVEGEILCTFFPRDSKKAVASDIPQNLLTETIRQLPSGEYTLRATAHVGPDSAAAKASFFVFSIDDKRLARHEDLWLYCPTDSFDLQHPARLQVGSSFTDVALYYCLTAPHGVVEDRLIQLSDEARLIEIPYKEEYGDGVVATFAFIKHGEQYQRKQSLRLTLPDRKLRWQWTSFRDRLHPGDREQWTLRLTTPDGSPAAANLMAVIYDASLDLLAPHYWQLNLARYHRLRQCNWNAHNPYNWNNASEYLQFQMKSYTSQSLDFDIFDDNWTDGLSFYGGFGGMRRKSRALGGSFVEEPLMMVEEMRFDNAAPAAVMMSKDVTADSATSDEAEESTDKKEAAENVSAAPATLRTNFNETAAFMPRLHTNAKTGEVTLSFTLPESLTTWQLLGVAHTQDFLTTNVQAQAVARKELMARLYLPRFLRAGDESTLRATVQNLTEQALSGKATLEVFNPENNKLLLRRTSSFKAAANGEAVLSFDYTPSEDLPLVAVRLVAETTPSKKRTVFSDGEQHYLAILPSKEWITESIEIRADSAGTFTTDLSTLFNKNNPTATQRRLTVEYTTHPIWNVVQALPSLREAQHDDVLSLTSVFYSNALSAHIASTTPRLHDVIELWKQQAATASKRSTTTGIAKPATDSPLALDEELKQLTLDETPWLREACSDAERRAQLIDLFNENLIDQRLTSNLDRLFQRQKEDGGFAWFPGMPSSELMTRVVAIELTRLRNLTNNFNALPYDVKQRTNTLLQKAFEYIAKENAEYIKRLKEREKKGETVQTGSLMHLHYVYISQRAGVNLSKSQKADVRYLLDHLKGTVADLSNDERAVAAIVLKADGRKKEAQLYYESMLEHLTTTDNHGTFFDYAGGSFTPTGHKIAIHTAAMEAVEDFSDTPAATPVRSSSHLQRGLRRWLLQQKRTQMWESSICTADAIYALLHGNSTSQSTADLEDTSSDRLVLHFGKRSTVVPSPSGNASKQSPASPSGNKAPTSSKRSAAVPSPSSNKAQTSSKQSAAVPSPSGNKAHTPSKQSAAVPSPSGNKAQSPSKQSAAVPSPSGEVSQQSPAALGYLRATYTDGAAPTMLTVERRASSEAWGAVHAQYLTPLTNASAHANGLSVRRELSDTSPRIGDKITTRYIVTADRDYEYVCLRADRAACAEPAESNSGYRYQGGLGYYRAVRDAHTDYFFYRLPKGTYVLEETAFIDRTGQYTTGLCRLQCLYAPEYNSHTSATTFSVSEE